MRKLPGRIIRAVAFCVLLATPITQFRAQDSTQDPAESNELPEPPAEIAKLLDRSKATFRFYDVRPAGQRYVGETHFNYSVRYQFTFRQQTNRSAGQNVARGTIRLRSIGVKSTIEVRIPRRYANDRLWESDLVLHEMDHVRIDSDPRIELLLRRLVSDVKRFEIPLDTPGRVTQIQVKAYVEEQVMSKVRELTRIVQANNDMLDQITSHGVRPGRIEESFFHRLFTLENLQEHDFANSSSVASLVKSRKYRFHSKSDGILSTASP